MSHRSHFLGGQLLGDSYLEASYEGLLGDFLLCRTLIFGPRSRKLSFRRQAEQF